MLNYFCFHVYAQKSLFIAENCNVFFLTATTAREFGVSRAGSQLKIYCNILAKKGKLENTKLVFDPALSLID